MFASSDIASLAWVLLVAITMAVMGTIYLDDGFLSGLQQQIVVASVVTWLALFGFVRNRSVLTALVVGAVSPVLGGIAFIMLVPTIFSPFTVLLYPEAAPVGIYTGLLMWVGIGKHVPPNKRLSQTQGGGQSAGGAGVPRDVTR